jgi:hypothetical protein
VGGHGAVAGKTQRLWVWGGVVSIVFFGVGWVALARFLPPLAPSKSATEIARIFWDRRTGIRFGALFMIVGTMLWVPWAAVVAAQPRRAEGDRPVHAWTQVGSAATAAAVIIMGQIFFIVAAFRPGRDPRLVLLLSDLGFITEILPFAIFVVWNLALALAILADDSDAPAYPRWSAYLCIWLAVLYLPGGALAFFHHGAFDWSGLMAFFIPAAAFFAWIIVMTVLALRALNRREQDQRGVASSITAGLSPARASAAGRLDPGAAASSP